MRHNVYQLLYFRIHYKLQFITVYVVMPDSYGFLAINFTSFILAVLFLSCSLLNIGCELID